MRIVKIDIPHLAIAMFVLDAIIIATILFILVPELVFPPGNGVSLRVGLSLVVLFASILSAAFMMGLYQRRFLSVQKLPIRLVFAVILSLIPVAVLSQFVPPTPLTVAGFVVFSVVAFVVMLVNRLISCTMAERMKRRVVFFGTDTGLEQLRKYEWAQHPRKFSVVGSLSSGPTLDGSLAQKLSYEVQRLNGEELVISGSDDVKNWCASTVLKWHHTAAKVTMLSTLVERETRKLDIYDSETARLLAFNRIGRSPVSSFVKRTFDVAFSLAFILFTLPLTVLAAILIVFLDGWPIFYTQERVGLGGRTFTLIKFRTMSVSSEADGVLRWTGRQDSRVTPIGRFLRISRIDEIPQLLNVLRGEMSVVGPRPERPEFVARLEMDIPLYLSRHLVLPGITGWAQINYPYGASIEDAVEKTGYDLYYVKNESLLLDVAILLQTVRVILLGEGSR